MAVLPAQRISSRLKEWLGLPNNHNINYLVKYGWLLKDKQGFYMHPVIKEVVKRLVEPQQNALKRLLWGLEHELSYNENPKYEEALMLIAYVESVLPFLGDAEAEAQLLYNISVLYGQFGLYEKALQYADQCSSILEKQKDNLDLLSSVYNHKGYIYYYIFEDEKAEENYKKAYQIRKKRRNKKLLAQTISSLSLLYQGMARENSSGNKDATQFLEMSDKYQQEAIEIFEEIFNGKIHPNLASAYNNRAEVKNNLGEFEEAERYFRKAEDIRLKLADKGAVGDLAVTYLGMGKNYLDMAENSYDINLREQFLQQALDCAKKSRKIRVDEIRKGNQK